MTRAGSSGDPKPSRAEQRAREKAEWAEHDALIKRLGELWPNYGCFCGTLEDLRNTVADFERRARRDRPNQRSAARDESGARATADDPPAAARLAVTRAQQRLQHGHDNNHASSHVAVGAHAAHGDADAGGEVDD